MRDSAEHCCSALAGTDLREAVVRLPWLCPGAAALTALGRLPSSETWEALRSDTGAVLLVLRQPGVTLADRLDSPALLDEVLNHLDTNTPLSADWNAPSIRSIFHTGLVRAQIAEAVARRTGRIDPQTAWILGLLTPLGWYAACTLNTSAVLACLDDPASRTQPVEAQRRHWGIDAAALARRLTRYWNLPNWLSTIVGHLGLPADAAIALGADGDLVHLGRLAIALAGERGFSLGEVVGDVAADAVALGLLPEELSRLDLPAPASTPVWQDPRQVPLLRDLLVVAAENRRLRGDAVRRRTEDEADRLHDALECHAVDAAERLRANKLAAMAEFAAGAGHEINNPLAVISGQAQYVLSHAAEWFTADGADGPRKSLQAIITQTKRIHGLLRDLMQFARPTPPRPAWFDLTELLTEVSATLHDLAEQRHVRLEAHAGTARVRVHADREQVKSALIHLLRNGIEAAPVEGWTRIVLSAPAHGRVEVSVEDSGSGPNELQRAHLFDPFFSGRSAGRGRGLGLPTAWRLAGLQGGDVRFDPPRLGVPTRFILGLPWSPAPEPEQAPRVASPVFTETVGLNGVALNGYQRD